MVERQMDESSDGNGCQMYGKRTGQRHKHGASRANNSRIYIEGSVFEI
jgi:hypothetical protein